jgi:hypothetical protein
MVEATPAHDALPAFPLPALAPRAWREEALARAAETQTLSNWLDRLPNTKRGDYDPDADKCLAEAIRNHVGEARKAAEGGRPLMRTGARLARATSNLHAAEANLLRRAPLDYLRGQLPNFDAHIRRHLPVDDPRRRRVEDLTHKDQDGHLDNVDRESLIGAVRAASSAAEREQQRVRSFRTIVLGATALLFVIAGLVGLLSVLRPAFVALCFAPQQLQVLVCPTGQSPLGPGQDVDDVVGATVSQWDVPLVEFTGMVAAGVTGAAALRHLRGSSTPFAVSVALIVLKLPTGALTAFLGLLLMRGGFVPGLTALDSTPQIIAWAVLFGASQQLVTGLVDRQAQSVLDSVGGKTYTPTGGS